MTETGVRTTADSAASSTLDEHSRYFRNAKP